MFISDQMFVNLTPGQALPNGATVIDASARNVLALWDRAGGTEYVTWRLSYDADGTPVTTCGHYYADLASAEQDFQLRKSWTDE